MAYPPRCVSGADDDSVRDPVAVCGRFSLQGLAPGDGAGRLVLGEPVVRINGAVIARGFPRSLVAPDALTLTGHSRRGDTTSVGYRYLPGAADLDFLTADDELTVSYRVRLSEDLDAPTLQTVVIRLRSPVAASQPAQALPLNGSCANGQLNQTSDTGGTVSTQADGLVRFLPSTPRHAVVGLGELIHRQQMQLMRWPGAALWWSLPSMWLWAAPPQSH